MINNEQTILLEAVKQNIATGLNNTFDILFQKDEDCTEQSSIILGNVLRTICDVFEFHGLEIDRGEFFNAACQKVIERFGEED